MIRKSIPFLVIALLVLVLGLPEAEAQCAMCRATVQNNVSNGVDRIGAGLNFGIVYLLLMPYVLIGTIAWLWYRNSKKTNERKIQIKRIISSKLSSM